MGVIGMHDKDLGLSSLFANVAAASAIGHPVAPMINLGGTREQVVATARVVSATRDLTHTLASTDASLDSVMQAVDRKNTAAAAFLQQVGVPWPL